MTSSSPTLFRIPVIDPVPLEGSSAANGACAGTGAPRTLEIVVSTAAFEALRGEWDCLTERTATTVFQTFDWMYGWWKHFGSRPNQAVHLLLIREGRTLIGIAPFYLETLKAGRSILLRRLRMLGGPSGRPGRKFSLFARYAPSDYLDLIAAPSREAAVGRAVAVYLNETFPGFGEVELTNFPEEGVLHAHLIPALDPGVYRIARISSEECPWLEVPSTVDEYLQSLRPSFRRKMLQARQAFRDPPFASVEQVSNQAAFHESFERLTDLHQKRWNGLGYPGVFSDPRFRAFQYDVGRKLFARGRLWFRTAWYGGEPIAARMAFRHQGRYYDYLAGFDPALPGIRRRPGLALFQAMLEDAVGGGHRVIDLLRGDERYKTELAQRTSRVWCLTLRDRTSRASLRGSLGRIVGGSEELLHSLTKEAYLLSLHYRMRGPVMFLPSYAASRKRRIAMRRGARQGIRGRIERTGGTE